MTGPGATAGAGYRSPRGAARSSGYPAGLLRPPPCARATRARRIPATARAQIIVLCVLTALLLAVAGLSLEWRMAHDAPLMLYFAWLVNHEGLVLYRDVFEHQPLGAHLAYRLVAAVVGYSDLGFRIFDLAWLAAILAVDFALLAPFGRRVAWAGAVLFGLAYLLHGPNESLQRDYLMLLPLAMAVLLEAHRLPAREWLRAGLAGALIGVAATVKPQAGLMLLGFVFLHARPTPDTPDAGRPRLPVLMALGAGFCVAPLAILAELLRTQTLGPFLDVVRNYWPLFARLDIAHRTLDDAERPFYISTSVRQLGGHGLWVAAAAVGYLTACLGARLGSHERRMAGLLGLLALLALAATAATGRFWRYHWFPFLHFTVLLGSLCLVELRPPVRLSTRMFPALMLLGAALLSFQPPPPLRAQLVGRPVPLPLGGRAEEIAAFLRPNLRPGDTVQSLDWTGGAVHGMLLARARTATPFVTDFYFYHHVSSPWIQELRARFLRELARAEPRYVIEVYARDKPWPRGRYATQRFPALENLLARDYQVVQRGPGFRVLERREVAGS